MNTPELIEKGSAVAVGSGDWLGFLALGVLAVSAFIWLMLKYDPPTGYD